MVVALSGSGCRFITAYCVVMVVVWLTAFSMVIGLVVFVAVIVWEAASVIMVELAVFMAVVIV